MPRRTSLKITVVGVNYAPERSGIAPYTTRLATSLAQQGHAVHVITSRPHYPEWRVHPGHERASRTQEGSVVVRRLRHYIPRSPGSLTRVRFEVSFGLRAMLTRWGRPDVVICVSPALISTFLVQLRTRLAWRRPATGLIVQDLYSRGLVETGSGGRARLAGLAARFEALVLGSFDGVAVIHDRFRSQVVEGLGIDDAQVSVIRNWNHVTPEFACDVGEVRASLGWGEETVVLHAGAFGVKQDLGNVVEAARLAEAVDAPVRFVLLGDGSQRARLAVAARGLSQIEFRDQVDDAAFGRILLAADVLLVNESPGLKEMAVPSKLTSYFRAGKPVLAATDEGSTTAHEVAAAGAGVRVAPGSPEELLQAALRLGRDPVGARAMGERGQEYCRVHLGEAASLRRYTQWVASLGGARDGRGHAGIDVNLGWSGAGLTSQTDGPRR